jgi:membrane-associated protease RseP (regulator of RpoE activity)
MLTVIAFGIVLSLLVFVHELGHFIVLAKRGQDPPRWKRDDNWA